MRIAFIAHTFPPYIGGTPGRVYRISRGLSLRGHDVIIYTSTHPRAPRVQEIDGLRVERYSFIHPAIARFMKLPYYTMPGMFKLLANKEETRNMDVVQTFNFLSYVSFLGACTKLLRKIPFSLSPLVMHHHMLKEGLRSAYGRSGIKSSLSEWYMISYFLTFGVYTLRSADLLAPQTMSEKNELMSYGVDIEKIRVIPGSIDIKHYKKLPDPTHFRKEYSIDDDEKIILFVGEPSLWKGTHHILLALEEVLKKVRKVRLILVGPSVNKAYRHLRKVGSSLVSDRTLITGPLVGKPLASAYSAADVFILPTKEERFGTVVLEALASGLPVISTRTGVAPDVIFHGKNGLFVEYGNVRQISEAIIQILLNENFKREAERERQSVLETYSSEREIESYEKAYRDIVP